MICGNCGITYPRMMKIGNKIRDCNNRVYCFTCSPPKDTIHGHDDSPHLRRGARKCKNCGKHFARRQNVNGQIKDLVKRAYCLDCLPFNFKQRLYTNNILIKKQCLLCHEEYQPISITPNFKQLCSKCRPLSSSQRRKIQLTQYKGDCCQVCGYNRCRRNLVFHHTEPKNKSFTVSVGLFKSLAVLLKEVDKCVLVCNNCHNEIHEHLIDCPPLVKGDISLITNLDTNQKTRYNKSKK